MRALPALVFFLLLAMPAAAQGLLPGAFAGWSGSPLSTVEPSALETVSGDDAGLLREFGAVQAERRSYTRGGSELVVTLYRMRDPTGAYGAFHFLRQDDMQPAELARYAALGEQRALVVLGHMLVEVSGDALPAQRDGLEALAAQLAPHADRTPFPTLHHYLPEQGLQAGSKRYLLGPEGLERALPLAPGDWVGFDAGAEAQLARYRVRGEEVSLLLVSYPTPQGAMQGLDAMISRFQVNPETVQGQSPAVFVRRSESLLAVVAGASSKPTADQLLRQIEYRTEVTWNEPGFKATEPGWAILLYSVFLGTGLIVIYMLVAAIVFGGFRLVIKRMFPGKVFDRPETMDVLQLGITSKPIEGKDFYDNPLPPKA